MCRSVAAALLFVAVLAVSVSATTIRVPDDYPLILDAMVFAEAGDTVLVACGTYYECNIPMKSGVTLMGETGEIGCARIDGSSAGRIIDCTDCDESTAIIGLTLASGMLTTAGGYGGGISCTRSSPWLENLRIVVCVVHADAAIGGGGLGCVDSSPTLTNVIFDHCILNSNSGSGGAMVTVGQSSPVLNDVLFDWNWTTQTEGGALAVQGYGSEIVRLNNVTFTRNSAATTGGALYVGGSTTVMNGGLIDDSWATEGGGVHLETCRPCTLRNVTFTENEAGYGAGGGLLCEMAPAGTATLENLTFRDNTAATWGGGIACNASTTPTLSYATFERNSAVDGGGLDVRGGSISIDHATFNENAASVSGGGIYFNGGTLDVGTSIIAFSTSGEGLAWASPGGLPTVSCTDIFGNAAGDWVIPIAPLHGAYGNLDVDPLFCDAANGDLTLAEDSPCAPANNSCSELIGAHDVGCPPASGIPGGANSAVAIGEVAPNPFGNSTALAYELRAPGIVEACVFDVSGRLVRRLVDSEYETAGTRTLEWDGRDDGGRPCASGIYFFRVDVAGESAARRAVLLR
jgi:predicted outer membrane repeat protein